MLQTPWFWHSGFWFFLPSCLWWSGNKFIRGRHQQISSCLNLRRLRFAFSARLLRLRRNFEQISRTYSPHNGQS